MRSMIFAALVAATTISVASAEGVSTPSPPPVTTDNVRDKPLGISPQQDRDPVHPMHKSRGVGERAPAL